jgi:hypothetical protein
LRYLEAAEPGDDDVLESDTLSELLVTESEMLFELLVMESEMLFELYENEQARLAAASATTAANAPGRIPSRIDMRCLPD